MIIRIFVLNAHIIVVVVVVVGNIVEHVCICTAGFISVSFG